MSCDLGSKDHETLLIRSKKSGKTWISEFAMCAVAASETEQSYGRVILS